VLATLVILGIATPSKIKGDVDETVQMISPIESLSDTPTIEEVKQALVYAANKYGLNETHLLRVSSCESGFKYTAVGKAGEIGILQYMPSTWVYWNKERIKELGYMTRPLDIYSTRDQIIMVGWAWNKNYQSHWVCFTKYY